MTSLKTRIVYNNTNTNNNNNNNNLSNDNTFNVSFSFTYCLVYIIVHKNIVCTWLRRTENHSLYSFILNNV